MSELCGLLRVREVSVGSVLLLLRGEASASSLGRRHEGHNDDDEIVRRVVEKKTRACN